MKVFRSSDAESIPTGPTSFTGRVRSRKLAADESTPSHVHAYHVEFDTGARTHWHTHSGAQWLFVLDGRIRVQKWGETAHEVAAGDAVMIDPGAKHWHGAAPGARGTHLAVNVNATTEWLEPVSDKDYQS
jgi:quercetin dioxygenase-like cupin family protein